MADILCPTHTYEAGQLASGLVERRADREWSVAFNGDASSIPDWERSLRWGIDVWVYADVERPANGCRRMDERRRRQNECEDPRSLFAVRRWDGARVRGCEGGVQVRHVYSYMFVGLDLLIHRDS